MFKCKFNYFEEASGAGAGDMGSGGAAEASSEPSPEGKPDAGVLLGGLVDNSEKQPIETDQKGEEKQEEQKPSAVPEKYELTVPEGFEGTNEELLNEFTPIAKELALTNEQAQKLAHKLSDMHAKQQEAGAKAQEQQWFKQREEWVNELKGDPEFGNGDEETFRGNVGKAQLALNQFGTPELKKYLLDTGLGDNVHVLKLMAKVGDALGEDGFVPGGGSGGKRKSAAEVIFDGK